MFNKITQTELNRRGATSLPTKPTIAPETLKRELDAPAKEIVAPAFNNLIDALESEDAATDIGAIVPEGLPEGTPNNLQSVLESINMISQDNKELAHKHDNKDILDTITEDVVMDADYVHTDNNYTDADKSKIANMVSDENYVHTDNNYTDSDKSDVASNTNARHTHDNKPTLDKFSEVDGKPQFDGQPIGGEVVVSETTALPSAIESANGNIKAISMVGNAHKSANVFDEVLELGSLDGSGNNTSSTTQTRSKNFIKVNPDTDYTISREGSGDIWIVGYKSDKTIIADGTATQYPRIVDRVPSASNILTFHTTSTTEYLRFYNNASTDLTVKIQINLGDTALPYEPYGILMPSGLVESENKNKCDNTKNTNGYYTTSGYNSNSQYRTSEPIKVEVGKNYRGTMFTNSLADKHDVVYTTFENANDTNAKRQVVGGDITIADGENFVRVRNNSDYSSYVTSGDYAYQLEEGAYPTDYVEHKSSSINAKTIIPSFDLASIGEVRNELHVFVDGSGKLIKRVDKVDLGTYAYTKGTCFYTNSTSAIPNGVQTTAWNQKAQLLCEKYNTDVINSAINEGREIGVTLGPDGRIRIYDPSYGSVSDFKSAMSGVYLYYILTAPIITDLTPSEVAQFLELQTYAPSCTVSADCECTISYHVGEVGQSIADVDAKVDKAFVEIDELTSDVEEAQFVHKIPSSTNSYDLLKSGLYIYDGIASSSVNLPSEYVGRYVTVMVVGFSYGNGTETVTQMAYTNNKTYYYMRCLNATIWGDWVKIGQ